MSSTKSERLDLRLTPEQKDAITTAASITGRSVTDFSAQALTDSAHETIARERQVRVDAETFAEFTKLLDRPARTNSGLADLLTRKTRFVD